VRRLKFIRAAQAAGFTLEEIRELLALDAGHDHARARALARERIGALDARIAELEQARDALKRLARDCARSRGPCPIITAFEQDG
jgi:MerR family mercuric resistance operon transcriptional regulator